MLNTTQNTNNRSFSKFLGNRKNLLISKRRQTKILNFDFLRENKGTFSSKNIGDGIVRVDFNSKTTGRTAFAFGPTMGHAYQNMISKFNIKYTY